MLFFANGFLSLAVARASGNEVIRNFLPLDFILGFVLLREFNSGDKETFNYDWS